MTGVDTPTSARAAPSIRTVLIAIAITAVLYVAVIGVHLTTRLTPAAARLQRESIALQQGYRESQRRAAHHDRAITALWSLLRVARAGTVPRDTLETLRASLQGFVREGDGTPSVLSNTPEDRAMARALQIADVHESRLRWVLLGAVSALELRDVPSAERLIGHADSLDTPLARALEEATDLSMQSLAREESELATIARQSATFVWLWLVVGLALLPFVALYLRARLYRPLAALDRGMDRLSAGDLEYRLQVTRDDELGRLKGHFNELAEHLRVRARETAERHELQTVERTRRVLDVALDAALDAVVVFDAEERVAEWNPQAEAVFGWTRMEMLGTPVRERIFAEPASGALARVLTTAHGSASAAQGQRMRSVGRRRDSSSFPMEFAVSRLEGTDRAMYALYVRDLSPQHAAQAALAESESRYRAAFEQSAVGMAEIDPTGRILRVNPALAAIARRAPVDLEGINFTHIASPEAPGDDQRAFEALVRGEQPFVRRAKAYRRPDGATVWVELTAAPVRNPAGELIYVFATVQDVSERTRLEDELRQSQKMDAVGQLAGGVAHDFNNLLAGIMGYADLLQHEDSASDAVRQEARAIVQTARRGADLAQKLLSLSRQTPARLEGLDLHEVVTEVHALISRAFDRSIEIQLELDDRSADVKGDRTQLSNAVLNLALNARDAMPHGGRLVLRTGRTRLDQAFCDRFAGPATAGEYVLLAIEDTGTGMSDAVRERIFEPFFTTKDAGKGTGLGLAMVYGTIRAHGGIIEVDSRIGRGTTFCIYLPLQERGAPRRVTPTRPALIAGQGHVLLADDETTVREVGARMLRRLGFTVDAVSDGEQAVAQFRSDPDRYAFIVLDGDMPRQTGRDAAREILGIRPGIPILLATGYRSPVGEDAETPQGFRGVLSKPFSLVDLSSVIKTHVNGDG